MFHKIIDDIHVLIVSFHYQLEIAGRTDIPVAEGSHVTITVCIFSFTSGDNK